MSTPFNDFVKGMDVVMTDQGRAHLKPKRDWPKCYGKVAHSSRSWAMCVAIIHPGQVTPIYYHKTFWKPLHKENVTR